MSTRRPADPTTASNSRPKRGRGRPPKELAAPPVGFSTDSLPPGEDEQSVRLAFWVQFLTLQGVEARTLEEYGRARSNQAETALVQSATEKGNPDVQTISQLVVLSKTRNGERASSTAKQKAAQIDLHLQEARDWVIMHFGLRLSNPSVTTTPRRPTTTRREGLGRACLSEPVARPSATVEHDLGIPTADEEMAFNEDNDAIVDDTLEIRSSLTHDSFPRLPSPPSPPSSPFPPSGQHLASPNQPSDLNSPLSPPRDLASLPALVLDSHIRTSHGLDYGPFPLHDSHSQPHPSQLSSLVQPASPPIVPPNPYGRWAGPQFESWLGGPDGAAVNANSLFDSTSLTGQAEPGHLPPPPSPAVPRFGSAREIDAPPLGHDAWRLPGHSRVRFGPDDDEGEEEPTEEGEVEQDTDTEELLAFTNRIVSEELQRGVREAEIGLSRMTVDDEELTLGDLLWSSPKPSSPTGSVADHEFEPMSIDHGHPSDQPLRLRSIPLSSTSPMVAPTSPIQLGPPPSLVEVSADEEYEDVFSSDEDASSDARDRSFGPAHPMVGLPMPPVLAPPSPPSPPSTTTSLPRTYRESASPGYMSPPPCPNPLFMSDSVGEEDEALAAVGSATAPAPEGGKRRLRLLDMLAQATQGGVDQSGRAESAMEFDDAMEGVESAVPPVARSRPKSKEVKRRFVQKGHGWEDQDEPVPTPVAPVARQKGKVRTGLTASDATLEFERKIRGWTGFAREVATVVFLNSETYPMRALKKFALEFFVVVERDLLPSTRVELVLEIAKWSVATDWNEAAARWALLVGPRRTTPIWNAAPVVVRDVCALIQVLQTPALRRMAKDRTFAVDLSFDDAIARLVKDSIEEDHTGGCLSNTRERLVLANACRFRTAYAASRASANVPSHGLSRTAIKRVARWSHSKGGR